MNLKSKTKYDKTQDKILQQHVEKGKVDFKVKSEIKLDIERHRKKYLEKNKTFPLRVKKVIETKDEPLAERVTKIIHLKVDT